MDSSSVQFYICRVRRYVPTLGTFTDDYCVKDSSESRSYLRIADCVLLLSGRISRISGSSQGLIR